MNRSDASGEQAKTMNGGLAAVLKDLLQTTSHLLKQELALAAHEWQLELNKAKSGLIYGAVGVPLSLVGGALLVLMLVHLLAFLGLPLWASFGLMSLLLIGGAVALLLYAKRIATSIRPVPQNTVDTIKETAVWIRQHVAGSRS